MNLNLDVEQEEDGRWLAEVLELPGAMAYGASADEAMVKAEALAFRALAEQLEHGEVSPLPITLSVPAAACVPSLQLGPNGFLLLCFAWDVVFAFHDGEEIGPRMLARIARNTGLTPEDL